jgi:integrase
MAWLERDRPSSPFQLVFRYGNQRIKRSTKTRNERDANEIVARVDRRLELIERGELTIPDDADVATFLMEETKRNGKPKAISSKTISSLFEEYFASLPSGSMEANSLYTANIHKSHFLSVLGANHRVRDITQASLQEYVGARCRKKGRRGKPIRPQTVKEELATLSAVWSFAMQRGHVATAFPNKGLKFPKVAEKPRFRTWVEIERHIETGNLTGHEADELWDSLFLTLPEIDELMMFVSENSRHSFLYPMCVTAAHTGARRSELLRSQRNDFDFETSTLTLREKKRLRGQYTTRTVPMSQELQRTIAEWFDSHPGGRYAFCMDRNPLRPHSQKDAIPALTRDQASDHLKRTLTGKWSKIRGWHVLRHSFASNCAAKGIDQRIINAWMGHQTEEMVKRYRHLIPDTQQTALELVFSGRE